MSHTAAAISGDIKVSSSKLTIAGADYPLTFVREIDAQHLGEVGKIVIVTKPTGARLYKLKIPATAKLLNGNTICGAKDASWLLTVNGTSPPYDNEQELALAFFSGDSEPSLDYDVLSKSTEECGTFGYSH